MIFCGCCLGNRQFFCASKMGSPTYSEIPYVFWKFGTFFFYLTGHHIQCFKIKKIEKEGSLLNCFIVFLITYFEINMFQYGVSFYPQKSIL